MSSWRRVSRDRGCVISRPVDARKYHSVVIEIFSLKILFFFRSCLRYEKFHNVYLENMLCDFHSISPKLTGNIDNVFVKVLVGVELTINSFLFVHIKFLDA